MKDARGINATVEFKDMVLKLPNMIVSVEKAALGFKRGSNASAMHRLNAYARRFIRLYEEVSGLAMPISFIVTWYGYLRFEVSLNAEDDLKFVTIKPVDENGLCSSKEEDRLYSFKPFFSYLSYVVDCNGVFNQNYSFPEDTRNDTPLMKILRNFGIVKVPQSRMEVKV